MPNPWIEVARILMPIEGIVGMVLNLLLLFYLARTNMGEAARPYYFSCIISAILSFYTSAGIFITIDLPTMINGNLIAIFYGPLLFYFPDWVNDLICVAFFAQVHTMWQAVSAPTILQWLALSKFDTSTLTKLVIAYASPLVFNLLAWFYMSKFLASEAYRLQLAESVSSWHETDLSEFHIYGIPVKDDNYFDAIDIAIFDLVPSFSVSYALFAVAAFKVRRKLFGLGTSVSERTKQMQRRFLLTQIAQVFLPLAFTSVPCGFLSVAAVLGMEFRNYTFFMAYMMWPVPAFTALLNLGFVFKSKLDKMSKQATVALTKNSGKSGSSIGAPAPVS